MNLKRFHGLALILTIVLISQYSPMAHAQPVPATSGANGMPMFANPYTNPYINPFMNPYMSQTPVKGNAALYFFAAQQANGGIGSGRLSGVHPERSKTTEPRPEVDSLRASNTPGGSAAGYFNRTPQSSSKVNHYYNRSPRYRQSNRK